MLLLQIPTPHAPASRPLEHVHDRVLTLAKLIHADGVKELKGIGFDPLADIDCDIQTCAS